MNCALPSLSLCASLEKKVVCRGLERRKTSLIVRNRRGAALAAQQASGPACFSPPPILFYPYQEKS